jgi:hypothetical protein
MSEESMREVVREILADVLAGQNGNGAGVPRVPPPPVAAVLRPSTWTGPSVPGEVVGDGGPAPAAPESAGVEAVTIDTDEDLDRFVRALLVRLEHPREREAIRAGRVRFALRRAGGAAGPAPVAPPAAVLRIAKGAVTERTVRDAAERGVRLVLARGAVLTPLAREKARALGVQIEKEGRC